jgi:hypothetical protein
MKDFHNVFAYYVVCQNPKKSNAKFYFILFYFIFSYDVILKYVCDEKKYTSQCMIEIILNIYKICSMY